jgi:hypothetical protein
MNTLTLNQPSHSSAFLGALSTETLRPRVPAVFARPLTSAGAPPTRSSRLPRWWMPCAHRGSSPWRLARLFVFPRGVPQLPLTDYSTPSRRSRSLMTRQ